MSMTPARYYSRAKRSSSLATGRGSVPERATSQRTHMSARIKRHQRVIEIEYG